MKRVRIREGTRGIVLKNGNFNSVLIAGTYWLGFNERLVVCDMSVKQVGPVSMDLMLKNKEFASMVNVIDVGSTEIVMVTINGVLSEVLTTGRYVFWKGLIDFAFAKADTASIYIDNNVPVAFYEQLRNLYLLRNVEIASGSKGLLIVEGKCVELLEAGNYYFWKNTTKIETIATDMRWTQMELSGQELLSKDKATIRITLNASFKVIDVRKALLDSKDFEKQLYAALQMALRSYVGNYTLDELLENKQEIATAVETEVAVIAGRLGVEVSNCGIKDIILTGEMRAIMNKVIVAEKEAQANIILRREQTAETRTMLNAAKLMEENETLFKLKEMEYVERIADKVGEISITGNGGMVKQLKEIFALGK